MSKESPQNYVGTKHIGKNKQSYDPNEHTFIDYKDLCRNYVDYTVQLADTNPMIALDDLYYSIKDLLFGEFCQTIEEDRNIHYKQNYELVKKRLKALEIIKETLPIDEEDFYYDEELDKYFFIGNVVSKDKYDLLKEVLL